jgi:bacillithiol system protein YtxJ
MNWIPLNSMEELEKLIHLSEQTPQIIFKHSTRCSISSVAKNRLEKSEAPGDTPFYYLDLLSHRQLSNSVAERFGIEHESPQILLIKDGQCVYDESHTGINMNEIKEHLQLN